MIDVPVEVVKPGDEIVFKFEVHVHNTRDFNIYINIPEFRNHIVKLVEGELKYEEFSVR